MTTPHVHEIESESLSVSGWHVCACGATRRVENGRVTGEWHVCDWCVTRPPAGSHPVHDGLRSATPIHTCRHCGDPITAEGYCHLCDWRRYTVDGRPVRFEVLFAGRAGLTGDQVAMLVGMEPGDRMYFGGVGTVKRVG